MGVSPEQAAVDTPWVIAEHACGVMLKRLESYVVTLPQFAQDRWRTGHATVRHRARDPVLVVQFAEAKRASGDVMLVKHPRRAPGIRIEGAHTAREEIPCGEAQMVLREMDGAKPWSGVHAAKNQLLSPQRDHVLDGTE